MIKIKNETAFVKNVKLPTKLILNVRAGVDDHNLCNKKSLSISIDPSEYIKGGVKSTGKPSSDLFNYISNVYDTIVKSVYFDIAIKEEQDIARRTMHRYQNNGALSDKYVASMINPLKETILNKDAVDFLSSVGAFNVLVESIDSDMERVGEYAGATLFLMMFGGYNLNGQSLQLIDNNKAIRLQPNFYKANHTMEEFINALTRVFFYYYSEKARMFTTARALEALSLSLSFWKNVNVWDMALAKFVPYEATSVFRRNQPFSVKVVSNNLNSYNIYDGERFTFKETFLLKDMSEDIFITSVSNNRNTKMGASIVSHGGYAGFLNTKNGIGEAVGILLELRHKDPNVSYIISNSLYDIKPYSNIMDMISDLAIFDGILYDEYEMFNSTQEMAKSKDVSAEVSVAYFTRAGGKTYSNYAELKDKRIPKQRRDLIYKALCHICYEYDVNPMDIIAKLDVDFTRYYKDAAPLE